MPLTTHKITARARPDSIVMILHGLGDSGAGGMLDIGRIWRQVLPDTAFLCPDAPFAFDQAPADFGGRQWFALRDFTQAEIDRGVREAAPVLNQYIDETLAAYDLKPARLALVGFSQGAMMALHIGLRRPAAVAGVISYSGMLTNAASLAAEKKTVPPILLAHGDSDQIVPHTALTAAAASLRQIGAQPDILSRPGLGHSIDDVGITAGARFLRKIFAS